MKGKNLMADKNNGWKKPEEKFPETELQDSFAGFFSEEEQLSESKTMKALSNFLRPEFINRIDEVISFNQLTREDFTRIAHLQFEQDYHALRAANKVCFFDTDATYTDYFNGNYIFFFFHYFPSILSTI